MVARPIRSNTYTLKKKGPTHLLVQERFLAGWEPVSVEGVEAVSNGQ